MPLLLKESTRRGGFGTRGVSLLRALRCPDATDGPRRRWPPTARRRRRGKSRRRSPRAARSSDECARDGGRAGRAVMDGGGGARGWRGRARRREAARGEAARASRGAACGAFKPPRARAFPGRGRTRRAGGASARRERPAPRGRRAHLSPRIERGGADADPKGSGAGTCSETGSALV